MLDEVILSNVHISDAMGTRIPWLQRCNIKWLSGTEYSVSRDGIDDSEAETRLRNIEVFSESNLNKSFF